MNALHYVWKPASEALSVVTLCTSSLEAFDKSSKVLKAAIGIIEDLSKDLLFYVPTSMIVLKGFVGQANAVNSLIQPFARWGEFKSKEGWGIVGTFAYKSKQWLTAGCCVEALRVLQSVSVIPETIHLFTYLSRFSALQSVATSIHALPGGQIVSSIVMQATGLELIKNGLIIGSAVWGWKKNNADYTRSETRLTNLNESRVKWLDRGNLLSNIHDHDDKSVLLSTFFEKKIASGKVNAPTLHRVANDTDTFVTGQLARIEKKRVATQSAHDKAWRGKWGEISKITVLSVLSGGKMLGLMSSPYAKGAIAVIATAGACFAFWKVVKDHKEAERATEAAKVPANNLESFAELVNTLPSSPTTGASAFHLYEEPATPVSGQIVQGNPFGSDSDSDGQPFEIIGLGDPVCFSDSQPDTMFTIEEINATQDTL